MKTCGFLSDWGGGSQQKQKRALKKKRFVTDITVEVTLLTMCCVSPSLSLPPSPERHGAV